AVKELLILIKTAYTCINSKKYCTFNTVFITCDPISREVTQSVYQELTRIIESDHPPVSWMNKRVD
ncbi:18131_t:CDS:1, partial [Dentiscutata erythropus]